MRGTWRTLVSHVDSPVPFTAFSPPSHSPSHSPSRSPLPPFRFPSGLSKARDTYIGGSLLRGVSGGERKRCNIAVEMLGNPSLEFLGAWL